MNIVLQIKNGYITPLNPEQVKNIKDGVYEAKINNSDLRTINQNKAQWLWLDMISKCLNDNNAYIQETIKAQIEWNKETVKALIFDPVMKAIHKKTSSTQLDKKDYEKIIDTIVGIFANKGIVLPEFPNRDEL